MSMLCVKESRVRLQVASLSLWSLANYTVVKDDQTVNTKKVMRAFDTFQSHVIRVGPCITRKTQLLSAEILKAQMFGDVLLKYLSNNSAAKLMFNDPEIR